MNFSILPKLEYELLKRCSKCKDYKVRDSFGDNKKAKDGKKSWCRVCCYKYRNKEVGKRAYNKYRKTVKGKMAQHRSYKNGLIKKAQNGMDKDKE